MMEHKFTEEENKRRERLIRRKAIRRRRLRIRRIRFIAGGLLAMSIILGGSILFFSKRYSGKVEFTIGKMFTQKISMEKIAGLEIPEWIEEKLLEENPYSRPGTLLDEVNGIVIHYVANPGTTAEQNNSFFAGLANQSGTKKNSSSSHFLIGMDGIIIQNVPLTEVAYCSNERNYDTISIECCHPDATGEFTEETYKSLVKLTAWLTKELHIKNEDIIRHYDVTGKSCPKYFVDNEEAWLDFKKEVMAVSKEK